MSDTDTTLRFGPYSIDVSSLDKELFPKTGITKQDLIRYSERVADVMLPHVKDRPLTFQRYPDGIDRKGFFQKNTPEYVPDWVRTETMPKEDGEVAYTMADNRATLVYLANQACLTIHRGLAAVDQPEHPLELVIDLDPPNEEFGPVQRAAGWIRDALHKRNLPAYAMFTGSTGMHVVVPLRGNETFDEVRDWAKAFTQSLAEAHPDELTTAQRKRKRGKRVFLDINRNAYGQTAVAPYSLRARPEAPVACPVSWSRALKKDTSPRTFTIDCVRDHLDRNGDAWKDIRRHAVGTLTERPTSLRN